VTAPAPTPLRETDNNSHTPIWNDELLEECRRWYSEGKLICQQCWASRESMPIACTAETGVTCEGAERLARERQAPANVIAFPQDEKADPLKREIVDASTLQGYDPQPVEWIVDGLIPAGGVCLLSGSKALGKSYMLLDLLAAAALGQAWFGHEVRRCKGFGMFCEDSDRTTGSDVLGWRLMQILRHRDAEFGDLENGLQWRSGVGRMSYLWSAHRYTEQGRPEELWNQLARKLDALGAQILILDTRSHVLNANANSGFVATMFINWLTKWAVEHQGTVILTVHPPKDASETWAGANEWHTVPRTHLHLKRPRHFDPESGDGRRERVLQRLTGNLADDDSLEIPVVWDQGKSLFVVNQGAQRITSPASFFGKQEFDLQVLQAAKSLILDGAQIYAASHLRWSLVRLVRRLPGFAHIPDAALLAAQDRLIAHGHLERVPAGDKVLLKPKG
jgi:hypothetical protein